MYLIKMFWGIMKTLSIILASLLSLSAPLLGEENVPASPVVEAKVAQQKLGKEETKALRMAYEKGEYDSFLEEMDLSYREVLQKQQLANLAEFRQGSSADQLKWSELSRQLQKEKNEALLKAIEGQEDSLFVQKVRSAASSIPVQERLFTLHQMAPGSGKNKDENRWIDLDLEYEYKSIHLDSVGPAESPREKHAVLRMEAMDKMVQAAESFADLSLKKEVEAVAKELDARLAKEWDQADLNAIARKKIKAADPLQEKIASLLLSYQEKFHDLSKQYLEGETADRK